jgi:hypothetical protein
VLDNSNSTALSFKAIAENIMSEHKKEGTRMKARYLAQAYRIAIEEIQLKTWNDYCREAINRLAAVLIVQQRYKSSGTLEC